MAYPKVTVIWVNYNGMRIRDVMLESLNSVLGLDYPNYEVVAVDNGSSDGSPELIAEELSKAGVRSRLIRLPRNRGFAAANNVGFRARSRDSKYVLLINNDAAAYPDGLRRLVEAVEGDPDPSVAAAQGVITDWSGRGVDNAGFIVDELLFSHAIGRGGRPEEVREARYCTFVSGAYSLYRVDAVIEANGGERLFDNHMFAYFDDKVLGMRLWASGFRVKAYPVPVARHYGSASFGVLTPAKLYLTTRAFMVMASVIEGLRYSPLIKIGYPIRRFVEAVKAPGSVSEVRERAYSVIRALLIAKTAAGLVGRGIPAESVPLTPLGPGEAIKRLLTRHSD